MRRRCPNELFAEKGLRAENLSQNSPVKPDMFNNLSVKLSHTGTSAAKNVDVHVRSDAILLRDPAASSALLAAFHVEDTGYLRPKHKP
jgi:hypothetical protein